MAAWIAGVVRWALTLGFAWAIWHGDVGAMAAFVLLQAVFNDAAALLLHRAARRLDEIDGRVALIGRDVERHGGALVVLRELEAATAAAVRDDAFDERVEQLEDQSEALQGRIANLETVVRGRAWLDEVRQR